MKKLLLGCLFIQVIPTNAVIKKIEAVRGSISEALTTHGTRFASLGSRHDKGPDISSISKEGRMLVAKMDSFGLDRYFQFETQADADVIQKGCYNGGSMSVEFYYIDFTKSLRSSF